MSSMLWLTICRRLGEMDLWTRIIQLEYMMSIVRFLSKLVVKLRVSNSAE